MEQTLAADNTAEELVAESDTPFFAVGVFKFLMLSMFTLGLYDLVWFYFHWKHIRAQENIKILAAARSIFAFIYCYPLLRRIERKARAAGQEGLWVPMSYGMWLVLGWGGNMLPGNWALLGLLSTLFLLPAQAEANLLNKRANPNADANTRFTWVNYVWMALGIILYLCALRSPA